MILYIVQGEHDMNFLDVNLDGKDNGIVIKFINNDNTTHFLNRKVENKYSPILFKNEDVARITARISKRSNSRAELLFKIGTVLIPLTHCYKDDDYTYRYIDKDNNLYVIHTDYYHKVNSIGYFVFENGDTNIIKDKKIGVPKLKSYMNIMMEAASNMILADTSLYSIKNRYRGFDIHIKGTTGCIRVSTISRMIDINQSRKEKNVKALPFIKDMDRYTTFYVCNTIDRSENLKYDGINKVEKALDELVQYLSTATDIKYVPIELNSESKLFVTKEDINGKYSKA